MPGDNNANPLRGSRHVASRDREIIDGEKSKALSWSLTEQEEPVSGPVNLLVLLQLPGDGIRAPLLVLAVILAGLAALAAETPHDTPRERHARLALFALPFHFCWFSVVLASKKYHHYTPPPSPNSSRLQALPARVVYLVCEYDVRYK